MALPRSRHGSARSQSICEPVRSTCRWKCDGLSMLLGRERCCGIAITTRLFHASRGALAKSCTLYRLSSGKEPRPAARSCERMRCPASVISFRSVAHADLWIPLCGYCLWGATSSPGLPFQGKICPWLQQQASVGQPSWMAPLARCSPTPKEGWACSLMLLSAGEPRRLCGLKASKHSSEKSV
jgi:hypothetical protein